MLIGSREIIPVRGAYSIFDCYTTLSILEMNKMETILIMGRTIMAGVNVSMGLWF